MAEHRDGEGITASQKLERFLVYFVASLFNKLRYLAFPALCMFVVFLYVAKKLGAEGMAEGLEPAFWILGTCIYVTFVILQSIDFWKYDKWKKSRGISV
ncbi:MAG: hypothetical protein WCT08_00885 [Patescibacteria group bacterium]|jgi:hypothetical protein